MRKVITKIGVMIAGAALLGTWFITPAISSSGRDCDDNAVIKCGTLTTTELYQKIRDGASGPHQSAAELRALFGKYQIWTSEFGNLRNGRVTKGNVVIVGDKIVGRDVLSMGRYYMPGSTQVAGVGYPLYLRHPSVSFNSNSLDAFVMLNSDGSMRYAVLKSCGNIIIPSRAPAPRYTLRVHKFIDANQNGRQDRGERPQANVAFTANNGQGTRTLRTNASGDLVYTNMPGGRWSVREWVPSGWTPTTPTTQYVTLNRNNITLYFGNFQRAPLTQGIIIQKYEDTNANRTRDAGEAMLSGWQFRVTGPNFDRTVATDGSGESAIDNLPVGRYIVTEINQDGWENTTGLVVSEDLSVGETQIYVFGNRRTTPPPPPPPPGGGGEVTELPVSGPAETAAATGAAMTFSGTILAWIRSKKNLLAALGK